MINENLFLHYHKVDRAKRTSIKGHQPLVLWMTGFSGSGKSTIANLLEFGLVDKYSVHTYLLDGDNIRLGLNSGLGFSIEERKENIRRVGEVAKLMYDAGLIVIAALISPFRADRDLVRGLFPKEAFWEIYVSCSLEVCRHRDPKGLYSKASNGQIQEFTGISSPYEEPLLPELVIDSEKKNAQECADEIIKRLIEHKIIKS